MPSSSSASQNRDEGAAVAAAPLRILIVDDEPDIEFLIRQRFRRRNEFAFVFARNGEEALQRLEEDPTIDLVITDINMPVMDGLTLLSRLNTNNGRILKAVILSAYGDMRNIRTAMNRGAFDFLTKPIDFQDFEVTIAKTAQELAAARQGAHAREELIALQQELEIASRIQQSILPRDFLPERTEFQIHAEMAPARHVGGDFYDFFLIDDDHLGFLIGDASGKGIPAALFMAVSRTLLRSAALQGLLPGECLEYANRILGTPGEEGAFVTAVYGILETRTGEVQFAIGGHNPPFVVSTAGHVKAIAEPSGLMLGLFDGVQYATGRMLLQPGDSLFLYTDGITEAMNPEEAFFSERCLQNILAASPGSAPRELAAAVLKALHQFCQSSPQTDDITMLAIRYLG